jgi:small subunit ribosomal protein S5
MAISQQPKEFEEKVIAIDRVARVVKGGRRFRFRATVVIGDGKGRVGLGIGKGGEVMTSIAKAISRARRNMITIPLKNGTIPHEVTVRFSGAQVMLKPASAGTGVIAGGAVRNVVEVAGIHDLLTKSFGSTNKVNNAYATIMALSRVKPISSSPLYHLKPKPVKKVAKAEKVTV